MSISKLNFNIITKRKFLKTLIKMKKTRKPNKQTKKSDCLKEKKRKKSILKKIKTQTKKNLIKQKKG